MISSIILTAVSSLAALALLVFGIFGLVFSWKDREEVGFMFAMMFVMLSITIFGIILKEWGL